MAAARLPDLEQMKSLEESLRRWHQPRIEHLKETRLLRDLDEAASIMPKGLFASYKRLISVLTARPYLTWQWAVASLSGQEFKYRNPFSNRAKNDESSSAVEQIAYGINAQVDKLLGDRGTREARRFRAAKQVVSGSIAWRPMLVEPDEASPDDGLIFDMVFYDPATVFWLPGKKGMQTVIRAVETTLQDAAAYVEQNGGRLNAVTGKPLDKVKCVDYWTVVDGQTFFGYSVENGVDATRRDMAIPWREQDGKIPIICGACNIPGDESLDDKSTRMDVFGRSILYPMIRAVRQSNHWESLKKLAAEAALFPDYWTETHDAQGVTDAPEPGKQTEFTLAQGERMGYLNRPSGALEASQESTRFNNELDMAGISPASLGSTTPMPPSAITMDTARFADQVVKLSVFENAYRDSESDTMMWWLREFRRQPEGAKIHLQGKHLEKNELDGYFEGDFTPKDVPKGYWEIVVDHEPARPLDKRADFELASAMHQAGMISLRRAMEGIVEDPEGEMQERERESIRQSAIWMKTREVSAAEDLWIEAKDKLRTAVTAKDRPSAGHISSLRREVRVAEAVFLAADRQFGIMLNSGAGIQDVQGQAGREAPQPNKTGEIPNPPSSVESPEARGEGREQKQMALMAGSRNGGS